MQNSLPPPSFWQGKRVLITGHTGFKGSWLALWLQARGAEVAGYALPPATEPALFAEARVEQGMTSVTGDIRDLDLLLRMVRAHEPDVVFHLAAQPLVRESYRAPVETYAANVMGTVNLLEAVRQTEQVRVVVVVTTDKVYENHEWVWGYRETDRLGGHDPYSSSKACAELVVSAYRDSFFSAANGSPAPAVASVRGGNVIGGGDWAENRLVPDIIQAFTAGRPVRIRNPHAIRPWQHVLELLGGYLLLAERLWTPDAGYIGGWNFGPDADDARPVGWVADHLQELWGAGASWEQDEAEHPHEASYLRLDCSKAKALLGWAPKLRLAAALGWTVEWYRAHREGADMRNFTLEQISRYESIAHDFSSDPAEGRLPHPAGAP